MADKDKKSIKESTEESQVNDKPAEESKVEEPVSDTATSTDDGAVLAGTDNQGRQLYSVKCNSCGKQTEVPFKPSGGRPVYCRDCYMQKKGRF